MSVTAFDADVLIYAANPGHPLRESIASHLMAQDTTAVGSVILLPEALAKPLRVDPDSDEARDIESLLSRLDLRPFDNPTARLATDLAVSYGLHAADSAHLATAVIAGADHFLTNNRKDFPKTIAEIQIIYPEDLADLH